MAHSLASADPFPYVSGLFRCDACEHAEPRQGLDAAVPPAGWLSELRGGRVVYFCSHCAPPPARTDSSAAG